MNDLIVRSIARIIIPLIQLYGLYIIIHGHLSPGGGFSGGAILGASFILYSLVFGLEAGEKKAPHHVTSLLEAGGILWYILLGLVGIIKGAGFLANGGEIVFLGIPGSLVSGGLIPLITIGIGLKVGSTIITLFHALISEEGH